MIKFLRAYIKNILVAVDRLASALLALDPDRTISWHLGHQVFIGNRFWSKVAVVIDLIMLPFDGKDHCLRVYLRGEDFKAAWRILEAHNKIRDEFRRGGIC